MERDHMVEHNIVLSFTGADCFSIFRTSIVVLSFCYKKKKGHCSKQDGRNSQLKLHRKLQHRTLKSRNTVAEFSEVLYPLCCGVRASAYFKETVQLFPMPLVSEFLLQRELEVGAAFSERVYCYIYFAHV